MLTKGCENQTFRIIIGRFADNHLYQKGQDDFYQFNLFPCFMKSQTTVNYLPHELLVQNNDNVFSVPYADVLTIVCDKPYIKLETIQQKFYIQQNLKGFCSNLPDYFQPCSKSVYVNLMHVSVIQKQNQGYILTISDKTYPVSRRRVAYLKTCFVAVKTNLQLFSACAICKTCKLTV